MRNVSGRDALYYSVESYFNDENPAGRKLFISIILFLLAVLISVPFIKIPVSFYARGMLRPAGESVQIFAPETGFIEGIHIHEGMRIKSDKILYNIELQEQDEEMALLIEKRNLTKDFIHDLKTLLSDSTPVLKTEKYIADFNLFKSHQKVYQFNLQRALDQKTKLKALYHDSLISEIEFETLNEKVISIQNETSIYKKTKIYEWQHDRVDHQLSLMQLKSRISVLENIISESYVKAPVSGYVVNLQNHKEHVLIQKGDFFCSIVPDTFLIAEFYVSPSDISAIRVGQKVRILVDSYDRNYQKVIQAKCTAISSDHIKRGQNAVFKVWCESAKNLCNSDRTALTPGMTLTGQFLIAEKTILQFIIDKSGEWFHPAKGIRR